MWKRLHDLIILLRSKVLVLKDNLKTPIVIGISVLSHETRTALRIYINNTVRVILAYVQIYSTGVAQVLSVVSGAFYFRFDVCNQCTLLFKMAYHMLTVPKLKTELIKRGGGTKRRKPYLLDW